MSYHLVGPCLAAAFLCGGLLSCSPTTAPNGKPLLPDGRYSSDYESFKADPQYRATRDVWYQDRRIAQAGTKNSKIIIHLNDQRGILMVDDHVAMDFPVCTGKSTYQTPRGSFRIQEKVRSYGSHTYGSVVNASGKCVNSNATYASAVPRGGRFIGATLPLWMRIQGGIGMHVGRVYRDADSHGCIRIPVEPCSILFDKCGVGTKVIVQNQ